MLPILNRNGDIVLLDRFTPSFRPVRKGKVVLSSTGLLRDTFGWIETTNMASMIQELWTRTACHNYEACANASVYTLFFIVINLVGTYAVYICRFGHYIRRSEPNKIL
uniref:AlNc14C119G6609 protein n=1 Tax=Albugo laibachii Nc14 TaxID=890382 RepID=F0WJ77_9STRA|nr:AlNc14C119G6609 [Albugo laibachii Nc14]|eukprot:CCA21324.1 AlNc14C119G6609 [Albugo laibachii Nc14]